MNRKVRITVWSDYVCPFCYLQEPVLERIRREYGDWVEVEWRAFELRPEPIPTLDPNGEYLHNAWNSAVYPLAQQRGMRLRLPPVQPRSRRALELAEFARHQGKYDETHRALFRAFFEDGKDLNDLGVLADIAASAGLDPYQARTALERGTQRERVLQDQEQAVRLGVQAVPTLVIGAADQPIERGEAISGARPYEVVRAAVERSLRREEL